MPPAQTRLPAMRDATPEHDRPIGRHALERFQGLPVSRAGLVPMERPRGSAQDLDGIREREAGDGEA